MEVDYDVYADGEALLGWLNARVAVTSEKEFDGNALIMKLATAIRDRLADENVEIAHLKLTLLPDVGPDMASLSLTQTAGKPEPTHTLKSPLSQGSLLINLRAEADPEFLKSQVTQLIGALDEARGDIKEIAAFRPGRPTPTHRMSAGV
jgi:hypothetical protein